MSDQSPQPVAASGQDGQARRYTYILVAVALVLAIWGIVSRLSARIALEHQAAEASLVTVLTAQPKRGPGADSLILRDVTYARSKDFMLPAGNAKFHVRLTRVLDRGDGWLRAGYQVLGKK